MWLIHETGDSCDRYVKRCTFSPSYYLCFGHTDTDQLQEVNVQQNFDESITNSELQCRGKVGINSPFSDKNVHT